MNILVTGGAGFIGSNIVDEYINLGHSVVIVDNLSSGKMENLNPKAVFYEKDIREDLSEIFDKHNFDIVNHHAAQIDVRKSVADPVYDAKINILGLLNLLELSVKHRVKKFINVSSGGVIYGDDAKIPIKEEYEPKRPISPYGVSKLTAEHYLYFYNKIHGLKYTTLRYSNVYGIRQDPKGEAGVVAIFSNKLLKGETPTIYGDGEQTRDYIYVKDIAAANVHFLDNGDNEPFNIATEKETTVNELFNTMKSITHSKNNPIYAGARPGELLKNCLDITKASKYGWRPKYSLKKGLKETLEWVSQNM